MIQATLLTFGEKMLIGYARVSTLEQNLDLQLTHLRNSGCEKIITDKISGSVSERMGLSKLLEVVRGGDTVVVWRLDRLGRSLRHLLETVNTFEKIGVGFKSLNESIDTTTPSGKLVFHIFAALAEFERGLIRERTRAGLNEARSRGRLGGRPKKLDKTEIELLKKLYEEKEHSVGELCKIFKISKPTLYSYLGI